MQFGALVWFSSRSGNSGAARCCGRLANAGKEAWTENSAVPSKDMMSDQAILVTGAAGFIGFHVARRLLAEGRAVVGLDNLNDYYDPALKRARLDILRGEQGFAFEQIDLADRASMERLFAEHRFARVVHFAAQAGVRYSIDQPHAYVDANLEGFVNVLEGCRHHGCGHLVYASSSSVYGANTKLPFSVDAKTDHPVRWPHP